MNIVHIIGNGFDLNLKLKTGYIDFLKHYRRLKSTSPIIEGFKATLIDSNIDNWSNFEIELGKYSVNFSNFDDFETLRQDIILAMSYYLNRIQNKFDSQLIDNKKVLNYLNAPYLDLNKKDLETIKSTFNHYVNKVCLVNVISLNYTNLLDLSITGSTGHLISYTKSFTQPNQLHPVIHIHGTLEERMIVGVNDKSQILNKKLLRDKNFQKAFIKTEYNRTLGHMIDDECVNHINKANIISILGCSIGDSDRFWWNLICEKLINENCILIIYHYKEIKHQNLFKNLENIEIEKIKNEFLSHKKGLKASEKEYLKSKIFVKVNSNYVKEFRKVL